MNEFNNLINSLENLTIILGKYFDIQVKETPNLTLTVLIQIAPFLITAIISIFTCLSSSKLNKKISDDNHKLTKEINLKNINEKKIQLEEQKLQEFYYPFYILLKKDHSLFKLFAKEEKKNNNFSTLIWLLQGYEFSDNDKEILSEIINVNNSLNNLILSKGGYVENKNLQSQLSQLSTHFTIINLAYNGLIKNDTNKYKNIVFPDSITSSIESEIKNIESNINNLSNL